MKNIAAALFFIESLVGHNGLVSRSTPRGIDIYSLIHAKFAEETFSVPYSFQAVEETCAVPSYANFATETCSVPYSCQVVEETCAVPSYANFATETCSVPYSCQVVEEICSVLFHVKADIEMLSMLPSSMPKIYKKEGYLSIGILSDY